VVRDIIADMKKWIFEIHGRCEVALSLDGLYEQDNPYVRNLFKKGPVVITPAFTPGGCTDLRVGGSWKW